MRTFASLINSQALTDTSWNAALAQNQTQVKETGKTNTSMFGLCKWYKEHKDTITPWLKEYLVASTRTGLRDLADAYRQFFKKQRKFPKFKRKRTAKKSFTVDVSGGSRFPRNGYFRLKRGLFAKLIGYDHVHRYANCCSEVGLGL